MSTNSVNTSVSMSKCAACGKRGDNLKVCTSCEQVSYCNAKCRNAHRSKHKKECKKYAAGIRAKNAASRADLDTISSGLTGVDVSDDKLFQDPPLKEDCEICLLPMPYATDIGACGVRTTYMTCCGKTICSGCVLAVGEGMKKGKLKRLCPYCRVPIDICDEGFIRKINKRIAFNDAEAFHALGCAYIEGDRGLVQEWKKGMRLLHRGSQLGSINANNRIASEYHSKKHLEKAIKYWALAAVAGHEGARYNLGIIEGMIDIDRSTKHVLIAAKAGHDMAAKEAGTMYKSGHVTKDEYANTLRAYQNSRDEMKSEERTKAARVYQLS